MRVVSSIYLILADKAITLYTVDSHYLEPWLSQIPRYLEQSVTSCILIKINTSYLELR